MKNPKIYVTWSDIKRGEREKTDRCPVARAIKRKLKFKGTVRVCGDFVGLQTFFSTDSIDLPLKVTRFTTAFDRNRPVKPFSFMLKGTF